MDSIRNYRSFLLQLALYHNREAELYAKYQAYYSGWLLRPLREQEYQRAAAYKRYAQRLAASYRVEAESWRQQIV